jgi:hypothetical protein
VARWGNQTAAQHGLFSLLSSCYLHWYRYSPLQSENLDGRIRVLPATRSPFPLCVHICRAGHTASSLLSDLETRLWPAQACSSRIVRCSRRVETSISLAFSTAMTKMWLLRGRDGGLRYLQERLQTAENCPMCVCEGGAIRWCRDLCDCIYIHVSM